MCINLVLYYVFFLYFDKTKKWYLQLQRVLILRSSDFNGNCVYVAIDKYYFTCTRYKSAFYVFLMQSSQCSNA